MVVYTSPTTLPIDLHKRYLMLYTIMSFITEVWSGLCKLTSTKEFWPNSTRFFFRRRSHVDYPETPTCEVPSNGVLEINLLPVCTGETLI